MAGTPNTSATLDALTKEVYPEGVNNILPTTRMLQREVPFEAATKTGEKYVEPVYLSDEQGFTYLGMNSGVETLEDAQAGTYGEAQVDGYGAALRAQIGYSTANKMTGGKASFTKWSSMLFENMMKSTTKRLEIGALYGQASKAKVAANDYSSGTTCTLTFDADSWADGMWAGMKNARIDFFNGTTKINTNADVVVTGVNFDAYELAVSGNATDLGNIADGHDVFFKGSNSGAGVFKEAPGLYKIATNSGSLFGIDASVDPLWKGVESAAGAANLTLSKILKGVGKAAGRGLEEELDILINTNTFATLNSDEAALRRHQGEKKKAEAGYQYLEFFSSNGSIKIKPHIYVKEGDAFGCPMKQMKRIGSTDTTFQLQGHDEGRIWLHIPDKSGFELRNFSEWTMYCRTPAQLVHWSGIVNT